MKILIPIAIAALAAIAADANAAGLHDGTRAADNRAGITYRTGARDPYTDGAKAGKFDVYADSARTNDPRDPYTDGAHD
ncbi:hypothetical protein BKK79_10630 [Cupriavidus sp. USMAA2-4]|uniref:hypothetical protein n=1 Tax=unclassified Cupriavidus TaxID=2640874 RepID=UPI0008A708BF|nr:MULTISPECIES: hypothetical protein [unclassified Cupriavidus]AOY92184.1 hypothetical protein BKK79_10630 [Cupriavidus sp. USMAA2-4]AOY98246.1 hypothetical protein BKK81_02245 [Cupriavidus sp. USMAHM13]